VSALVVGRRGYHPIGEAIEHEILIRYVTNTALAAAKNLESCEAGYQHLIVPKIRVIGGGSLGVMSVLVDKTIQKAKRIVAPIFLAEGLLLILLLAFL
jgi:predicted neutral ceramidase superfamily lipid hydrolase